MRLRRAANQARQGSWLIRVAGSESLSVKKMSALTIAKRAGVPARRNAMSAKGAPSS